MMTPTLPPGIRLEDWQRLTQALPPLDAGYRNVEDILAKVAKAQTRLDPNDIIGSLRPAVRLTELYPEAYRTTTAYLSAVTQALEVVERAMHPNPPPLIVTSPLDKSDRERLEKKRKLKDLKGKEGSRKFSALGDVSEPIPKGHFVAVTPPNQDTLLAVVLRYIPDKHKYEVEDADDEEDKPGIRRRYIFPARSVLAIPTVEALQTRPLFTVGREVLALFPNSTCFYKAVVTKGVDACPVHVSGIRQYAVQFDDDGGIDRIVPENMVLPYVPSMKLKT